MPTLPSRKRLNAIGIMGTFPFSSLEAHLPISAEGAAQTLSERLAEELRSLWKKGEQVPAEDLLNRHPELWQQPEQALDILYEEVCLRQEQGEADPTAEVLRRFPQWRSQLEVLLQCHQLLEPGRATSFPQPGEALGEFAVLSELGRGARGRVYLAAQPSLADRLVVLKLTPRDGQEHLSLARLQHTHIVPIHSVQDDDARNLRLLCMPYFGGLPLSSLLQALADRPADKRIGRDLLEVLDRNPGPAPPALPPRGAVRHFLERASYAQALCGIGACLADALQYAHERGLVHLDVKPSNVLVAADGQPMLLDFHLARPPIAANEPAPEWLGGTAGYMAPEQQAALRAVRAGQAVSEPVDARADIYGLGLVLYEALGGKIPLTASPPPRLDRLNPQVSAGLADIVHKCIATQAADRYSTAAELAGDLRRHLTHHPLRGVSNRLPERWRKWRRRRPNVFTILILATAVVIAAGAVTTYAFRQFGGQLADARTSLEKGNHDRAAGNFDSAAKHFQHGLELARGIPFQSDLAHELRDKLQGTLLDQRRAEVRDSMQLAQQERDRGRFQKAFAALHRGRALAQALPEDADLPKELESQVRLTERMHLAGQLHDFVDRLRLLYDAASFPSDGLEKVEENCRTLWERRHLLIDKAAAALPASLERQLADDLRDLAILWLDVRAHGERQNDKAVAESALCVLAEAESLFGPSRVLFRERQRYAQVLGREEIANEAERRGKDHPPRTAWEHYALGRSFLRAGLLKEAAAELRQAVRVQPDGLWPNFYEGACAYRDGRYDDAVASFTACTALAPANARCFFNRAMAHTKLKRVERALADYDQALALEPAFAAAALNRGLLHFQAQRYPQALDDLLRARDNGAEPALVHYNLALVHRAQGDHPAAVDHLHRALRHDPKHQASRKLLEQLQP
jgi:serine/threonine protein kinase